MRRLTLTRVDRAGRLAPVAPAEDRLGRVERLASFGDIVDTEDVGPGGERQHVRRNRAPEPLAELAAGDLAEEALSRGADHDRPAERRNLAEAAQQLEVVLDRLAEADPRIHPDPL